MITAQRTIQLTKYVTPIVRLNNGCDWHRIVMPFHFMGFNVTSQQDISRSRLIVFNRVPHISNDSLFRFQKRNGLKYVLDLDDHWILDESHHLFKAFTDGKVSDRMFELIKNADAITVTNRQLADEVVMFNSNTHIIPNALPFDTGQFMPAPRPVSYKTRFIYAGGNSHFHDVQMISDHLQDIPFQLAGFNQVNAESKKIAQLVPNAELLPLVPIMKYMEVYNKADVSLAPLSDNLFNRCKSNLKTLEAGAKGLAIITSKTLPYYNELDAPFVDYSETSADWKRLIDYCIDNPAYAYDRGARLAEHVRKHYSIHTANEYRKQLYTDLVSG